jgi:hypothetical protein
MPVGTGAETFNALPTVPYIVDPATFFAMTEKQTYTAEVVTAPGSGSFVPWQIPQVGIVSKLLLVFQGTLTVTAAGGGQTQPVPGGNWPYGLLEQFILSANGQNNLWLANGLDLVALREARNPALTDHVDLFPGNVGGGGSALAAGSYTLYVSWEVPISMDDTWLIASLYAQSSSTNLAITLTQETPANLIAPGGTPALWTVSGNFSIVETFFEIPVDANGRLVLPDITKLHTFVGQDWPFSNTGEVAAKLIRSAGQMERLFLSARTAPGVRLSALPSTASASKIDAIRLQYGGTKSPLDYVPAAALLSINNQQYGAPLPYDRLCMDFIRENPSRDVVLYQGVTELEAVLTVDPAVTPTATSFIRTVQESLV